MEVVAFPEKIQKEVVPYVRRLYPYQPQLLRILTMSSSVTVLGPDHLRRVPPVQARLGRLHVQRCTRCVCRIAGSDSGGEEGFEGEGCGCW
jgi:hypothetical protein